MSTQSSAGGGQKIGPVVGDLKFEAGLQAPTFQIIVAVIQIVLVAILVVAGLAERSNLARTDVD